MSNETNNETSRIAEDSLDDMKGRFLTFYIDDAIYGPGSWPSLLL